MTPIPEIRVTGKGPRVSRVEWDPCVDGATVYDLTGMQVARVERCVEPGSLPVVRVSFVARLVEIERE